MLCKLLFFVFIHIFVMFRSQRNHVSFRQHTHIHNIHMLAVMPVELTAICLARELSFLSLCGNQKSLPAFSFDVRILASNILCQRLFFFFSFFFWLTSLEWLAMAFDQMRRKTIVTFYQSRDHICSCFISIEITAESSYINIHIAE